MPLDQTDMFSILDLLDGDRKKTIDERWREFHAANPHVGATLLSKAQALRARGVRRWGIANLWEVMRYDWRLKTTGKNYKLNNDYKSLYARWIMEQDPSLQGFFELRKRTAKGAGNGR